MKTGVREGHTETLQSWRRAFGHFCEKKGQITRISHQAVPFLSPLQCWFLQSTANLKPITPRLQPFFPRFWHFACFLFEFSLAPRHIFLSSHWPLRLLWFWFWVPDQKALNTVILVSMISSQLPPNPKGKRAESTPKATPPKKCMSLATILLSPFT